MSETNSGLKETVIALAQALGWIVLLTAPFWLSLALIALAEAGV